MIKKQIQQIIKEEVDSLKLIQQKIDQYVNKLKDKHVIDYVKQYSKWTLSGEQGKEPDFKKFYLDLQKSNKIKQDIERILSEF